MLLQRRNFADERGSSAIELLITGLLLILPLTYLAISLGQVHSAVLAAEGGVRQAARLFVRADTVESALAQSELAMQLAFDNHHLDGEYRLAVHCLPPRESRITTTGNHCLIPGARVTVSVQTQVLLPFIPGFIPNELVSIPIHAEAQQIVSKFAGAGR